MLDLQLTHCGSMSQVGDVFVFGLSRHIIDDNRTDTVYINFAGPVTSVEAVWARLMQRKLTVTFTELDGRSHHYIRHGGFPGLVGDESPYVRFQRRIEGLAIDHMILIDRRFAEVNYNADVGSAYMFECPNFNSIVGHHIRNLVNLAVFDEWYDGLVEIGRRERLITPIKNYGHPVYHISLNRTRWELQISLGVQSGLLAWPEHRAVFETEAPAEPESNGPIDLTEMLKAQGYEVTTLDDGPAGNADPLGIALGVADRIFSQAMAQQLEGEAAEADESPDDASGKPLFSADDIFSAYTRAQAIEDGVLIDGCIGDLAEVTKQHYPCHVAMTAAVWNIIERAVSNEKQLNDYKGVWHDILWMSRKFTLQISPGVRRFKVKITGAGRQSLYTFKLVEGYGDEMEPVITIMMLEED